MHKRVAANALWKQLEKAFQQEKQETQENSTIEMKTCGVTKRPWQPGIKILENTKIKGGMA
jgi:hypothetical protein